MFFKKLLTFFPLICGVINGQYFKTNTETFLQNINGNWEDFGQFAAVNMGVTKPGHLPGEIILTKENYLRRFNRLEKLGVKVIRVYALLHPEFYETLIEWNESHEKKIYILHGTAFPEYEMEEDYGTDAFDHTVSDPMTDFIERTTLGVYGQGEVVYKYKQGVDPVVGNYQYNIAKYLIGWVVAGEMSPYSVHKTNLAHPDIEKYEGEFVSSVDNSSPFEVWMAQNMDHLASLINGYGYTTPISWTNWATTDGIKNSVEPPYIGDDIKSSIEDWQEIDLHNFDFSNWEAGSFYNQHAYPYYPEFITFLDDEDGEEQDPYVEYITRIRNFYNDLPFIITEVGLSTAYGVASFEEKFGRNHGHVTEEKQGELMRDIMLRAINDIGVTGIVIFQLQDEWFKKSWNTLKFEPNEADGSGRNYWMNAMSAEQGFGIFRSEPQNDMKKQQYNGNEYFDKLSISNDERFIKLNFEIKNPEDGGKVLIGLDSLPDGSDLVKIPTGYDEYGRIVSESKGKRFSNLVDYLFEIDIETHEVKFYVAGCHDYLRKRFGDWFVYLESDEFNYTENFTMYYNSEYLSECDQNTFQPYLLLVKLPDFEVRNDTYLYTEHKHLEVKFEDTGDNLALLRKDNDNHYEIKIPFGLIGYTNPALNKKHQISGFDKSTEIIHFTDDSGINFEISRYSDINIETQASVINMDYKWNNWEVPKCYKVSAKDGFKYFRQAFASINNYVSGDLTDEEIATMSSEICEYTNIVSIHHILVQCAFIFLAFCFFFSSIRKFLVKHVFYCYSFQKPGIEVEGSSSRLEIVNLILFGILCILYYIEPSFSVTDVTIGYVLYIFVVMWDSLLIFFAMIIFGWDLYEEKELPEYDILEHAFVISCHNSANVLPKTLRSLIEKVRPETIYVGDNGSTEKQQQICNKICYDISKEWYVKHKLPFDKEKIINYGHSPIGNKTISQFASISNLPEHVKYVTCIDDDTRLHETWETEKVIHYFQNEDVAVLAYPLKAVKPQFDIELFQSLEYIITGFFKICHGKVWSTIFNSGAFGTYRVELLKEAFQYHNTDFHGDDLQICLNIHQLKNKKYLTQENKVHTRNYRVVAASNMVVSTIVPKCWIHLRSVSRRLFPGECDCDNPDLLGQRAKGWFVSKHRFIPKYFKVIFNCKGIKGMWVRLVIGYDLFIILNEYFAIFYMIFLLERYGVWLLEGFIIATACNIFILLIFNQFILKRNKINLPVEAITTQPIIYKIFMITIYRYLGLLYNLFVYTPTHRTGKLIRYRLEEEEFRQIISDMYIKREVIEEEVEDVEIVVI